MKVVAISDTHAPRWWRSCPPAVAAHLRDADLILHAGDVCVAEVLDELSGYAPVRVVLGNNDGPDVAAWGAPRRQELDLDGLSVAMVHDSGPAKGRTARMRRWFPAAALWSSAIHTSRWMRRATAYASSIPVRRPTAGASPTAPSASSSSKVAAISYAPRSSP